MQPVGELDDDDANVARHRHKHLAQVLDLRIFFGLIRDAGQLGDPVDEARDFFPEVRRDLIAGNRGIFDDVVQQRRRDRLAVHLEFG